MRLLVITQKVDETDDVLGFFTHWIAALSKRVDSVKVICLAKGLYSLPDNVEVVSLGKERRYPKLVQAVLFYWHAFKFLLGTDGVFVHMAPEYVRVLYPLNIFFHKPIVMWYAHVKVSPMARWALDHVNYVCTPSRESFEYNSPKVVATGHGINTEVFKPMEAPQEGDVLSLGRISKVKRIETLLRALKIIKHDLASEIVVDIYGSPARPEDDTYLAHLRELEHQYGLSSSVRWKGSVANRESPKIYASHRIFVRMQGGGGFGKVELEAMSMGLPAIVPTDVYKDDLAEWADDLYFTEDDAQALAHKIERVLGWSEERRRAYAIQARQLVVTKHNIEHVAEEVVRLLNKGFKR
jgi:glycosyltransferase involved in cell wall biosynthesis